MAERRTRRLPLKLENRAILQDARKAMGNDLMNALVELITNADDSYTRLEADGVQEIVVGVDRKERLVWVSDQAEGMTAAQMEQRLAVAGAQTSGFAAQRRVRGFFGRGAKDVPALGDTTWITRRDGLQQMLTISLLSDDDDQVEIAEPIADDPELHGTEVSIRLSKGVRIPGSDLLQRLLARHFALVPILKDESRRVLFTENGQSHVLQYEAPDGEQWLDEVRFELTDYPGQYVTVSLYESPVALDAEETGRLGQAAYRRHSLLVTSGRAAYEMWPGGSYAKPPDSAHLRRLFGRVDVPLINAMLEESEVVRGGEEIVDRSRRGLVRGPDHQFTASLDETIELALEPHMRRLREHAQRTKADQTSPKTKKMLSRLAAELNKYKREQEEGEDLDDPTPGSILEGLCLIPSRRHVEPLRPATLVVRYQPMVMPDTHPIATITVRDEALPEESTTLPLLSRGDYYSATFHLDGREADAIVETVAEVGSESDQALVMWEERRVPLVDALRFQQQSYTMKPGATRNVRLVAPVQYVDATPEFHWAEETDMEMQTTSQVFQWDDQLECCVYTIRVSGEVEGVSGTIVATVGDEQVFADIHVRMPGIAGMNIELYEKAEAGAERSWYDATENTLFVNANHADVERFLGPHEQGRPGQEQLPFRTLLRELACHAIVSYTLQDSLSDLSDPSAVLGAYEREYEQLVERTRNILVPDAQWA